MIRNTKLRIMLLPILCVMCWVGLAQGVGEAYEAPPGGWAYYYEGAQAAAGPGYTSLDGTWSHDNGSDAWDESSIGSGRPGGVSALTDGAVTYIRVQETGDPRDYGMADPGSNRKIQLGHSIPEGGAATILDDGVTLTFRTRLATSATGPVDDQHPDGGGGPSSWPAGGDGYVIHDGGKGNFGIRQSSGGKLISFGLALVSDDDDVSQDGLVMNKAAGTSPSNDVDLQSETGGTINLLPISTLSDWHEYWIQIEADTSQSSTHKVTIWMDGNVDAGAPDEVFYVTAGSGTDFSDSYINIGAGATPQSGAFDVDFYGYAPGLHDPVGGEVVNQPPEVDAGGDQEITMPVRSVMLDGMVSDDGLGDPDGFLAQEWSKVSGPGEVEFQPDATVEDPTAVFQLHKYGDYVLQLNATDGELDANDYVTIAVHEPNCPVGDLNGDCVVDSRDLYLFSLEWLTNPGVLADLSGDNFVDYDDFRWLASNWLENWQIGAIQVTINPQGARDAGAQWRVPVYNWHSSGEIQDDLPVGSYTVEFSAMNDWDKPDDLVDIQVIYGQVTQAGGTYIRHTGLLQVNISPPEVVSAGAQWQVDSDGNWHNSGHTESNLPVGLHTVSFSPVNDWSEPTPGDVQIDHNQTAVVNVSYTPFVEVTLRINEFMASNNSGSGIADPADGDYEDWIEIYNISDAAVNIGGMYITDDMGNPTKYRIPSDNPTQTNIPVGGYLLLWADGEPEQGTLHLSFQLDADAPPNNYIGLYNTTGTTLVDSITYGQQVTNKSYGRYPDGSDYWYFFGNPTPWVPNDSTVFSGFVADTKFNPDRGLYEYGTDIDVTITTATPGATIFYTLDGSDPINIAGTPTGSALTYSGPIHIDDTTDGTTLLRAAATKTDYLPTNIDTHSYIYLDDVLTQDGSGLPSYKNWGHVGADWEMDPIIVGDEPFTDLNGQTFYMKDALKGVPTLSLVMDWDDWFGNNGIYSNTSTADQNKWERVVSSEYILPDGSDGFQLNGAIRIVGGSSTSGWKSDKVSMRLIFKPSLKDGTPTGGPTQLRYKMFTDSDVDEFNTIVLDARLNNVWNYGRNDTQRRRSQNARDQYASDLQNAAGGYGHHGQHVQLYINGLYWGIYNAHERPDTSFAASYFGGDPEDYDCIKHSQNNVVNADPGSPEETRALNNYDDLIDAANQTLTVKSNYEALLELLDAENFIDYMLINFYIGNTDWAHQNWYVTRNWKEPGGKWRFHSWDAEKGQQGNSSDWDNVTTKDQDPGDPTDLHRSRLKNCAEYRLLFADRAYRHMFNGGPLSETGAEALYQHRLDVVDRAVAAEAARWGDNRIDDEGTRFTRDNHWIAEKNRLMNIFPIRTNSLLGDLKNENLYPYTDPPVFYINGSPQHGGAILQGDQLTMTNPNGSGDIYYTLNSSDPREYWTGIAVGTPYSSGETLTRSVRVKARVRDGGEWSALAEAVYGIESVAQNVRLTELMYHPPDPPAGDPNTEFIEVMNIHPTDTINLALVRFTNGVEFEFPFFQVNAGQRVVVVKDQAAFETRYGTGINVAPGEYSGSLSNGGERIELVGALGAEIHNFRYSDGWYEITDGLGFSLTIRDPNSTDPNDWDRKSGWRASFANGGSPGEDDSSFVLPEDAVIVNELLAHADTLEPNDWVEFYNTTDDPINIGGWFISDNDNDLMKYEIEESLIIPSHGYRVFYADPNFGPGSADPGSHTGFAFSESGEKVYLTSGSGGEITGVYSTERKFDPSEADVAFGHYVKSTGGDDFVAMSSNTPGWQNEYPLVGPVVLTEIAYHPRSNSNAEYVELLNISGAPVTLYDSVKGEPWRFVDDPDDPGLEFYFPAGSPITLGAGKYLLLVKNLTVFTSVFGAPSGPDLQATLEWGIGNGSLSNGGEKLELQKPGDLEDTERMYIRVDRVTYDDEAPWPTEPDGLDGDGNGSDVDVLERIDEYLYGNEVVNWQADGPTPGKDNDS